MLALDLERMCYHVLFQYHTKCAHFSEPRLPILPIHCDAVANALFHYHDQLMQPPQPVPLKMPNTCLPIRLPHELGGNIFVAELDGLCRPCEEEARLTVYKAWISGRLKRELRSQESTLVNTTSMTTPAQERGLCDVLPKERDSPIIADSSVPAADDIKEGTEVGDVVYRKRGWELLKRAASTPPWISYGWFNQDIPAVLHPETPLVFDGEVTFTPDEWATPIDMRSPLIVLPETKRLYLESAW